MANESNELYYNREKLYSDVWKHSLAALCKQYGVLHAALVNACETLNVPRPPMGYWTQKELGKASSAPELPSFNNPPLVLIHPPQKEKKIKTMSSLKVQKNEMKEDVENTFKEIEERQTIPNFIQKEKPISETISPEKYIVNFSNWSDLVPKKNCILSKVFNDAVEQIEKEKLPVMAIAISQTIEDEHPYVKNTRIELEKRIKEHINYPSTANYGRLPCYGKDHFDISVGPDSVKRVIIILQALCKAFEKRGFSITSEYVEYIRNNRIYIVVNEEKISFSIKESSKKVKLEKKDKNSYYDYEFIPTGKLTLQILNYSYQWSDSKKTTIEENLNDIVAGLIFISALEKENEAQRKKNEEERKHREELEREERKRKEDIEKEKRRIANINKQRIVNFKKATEYWIQYQDMSAFLSMVKREYKKSKKKDNETTNWIKWASDYLVICKNKYENLVCYNVEEYEEEREVTSTFRSTYNPPPPEPYNYWKKPWYQKR